jgi:mannose-6-phosphate isomerase-like protein (cupin superfamily)
MRRLRIILAGAAIGALGAVAVAHVVAQSNDPPAVKRDALAQSTNVKGAKGRTLGLSRVVIPPRGAIALHHHEGTQIAFIQSGVLTYTVRDGVVTVMRGPADDPQIVRQIRAGQTGKIAAGQWIVEQPSTIHQATNQGKARIVIYLSTLLKSGAPPSTPNQ